MKFHAIALGSICVVVVLLYLIMGPSNDTVIASDPDRAMGNRFVQIVDATWGLNCNPEINRLRSMGQATVGEGNNKRTLQPVQPNNVIIALTEACSDKIKCSIIAANDILGADPLSTCYKQLVVGYRCFSVDRKWTKRVEQGTLLTIDCHADVDQAKATQ